MTENEHRIVATRRNEFGTITDVKLDNGTSMTKERAIAAALEGKIEGVNVGKARDGRDILRGNPTDKPLTQLPTF